MESEKATTDRSAAAAPAAPARTELPELLRFLETERRRSTRASFFAALFGVTFGALATAAWWARATPPAGAGSDATVEAIAERLDGLERSSGSLSAQVRALASRPAGGSTSGGASSEVAVAPRKSTSGDAEIAGKPSTSPQDDEARARHAGDEALVHALARAQQRPLVVNDPPKAAEAAAADAKLAAPASAASAPDGDHDAKADAKKAAEQTETVINAFNGLLTDCGLEQWRLMSAELSVEDHSLHKVVMAHRMPNGTAYGSLTADRLALERDAGTGVAAFVLTGARQTEAGIEEAFANGTTRLEVPGVLPVELVPASLSALFGSAQNGAIGTTARFDVNDPVQVVRAINRVLAMEKGVALRLRSCERFNDDKLEKAIFDLTFDDRGEPQETIFTDKAWFELDAKRDYVELVCEGGDVVAGTTRRPLFRGHRRVPIHSVTPPQWRGMPSLKLISGS